MGGPLQFEGKMKKVLFWCGVAVLVLDIAFTTFYNTPDRRAKRQSKQIMKVMGYAGQETVKQKDENEKLAIRTEVEATLGTIRSAEKIFKSEHNTFTNASSEQINSLLGVNVSGVHWFDASCYDVVNADATHFTARCTVNNTTAPGAVKAKKYFSGVIFTINENGITSP